VESWLQCHLLCSENMQMNGEVEMRAIGMVTLLGGGLR